jgi:cytohesin
MMSKREIVDLLITKGADVNAKVAPSDRFFKGKTPLDLASKDEIADLLRKHGAKTSEELKAAGKPTEPVAVAAQPAQDAKQANPEANRALFDAIIDAVIKRRGNIEAVKQAIADGADLETTNEGGNTPLLSATKANQKEIAELLIANGADVNAKGKRGWTPLHTAAAYGHKEIVELLIANGADVNTKMQGGSTPLHHAALRGRKDMVELLIANGANMNARSGSMKWTPLHEAARKDNKEIAELLIAKGADVNAKSEYGNTPLDRAIQFKRTETADLLRKHGGKTEKELEAEQSIHDAARLGITEAIKLHLAKGADVNAKDQNGKTPLHHAAWQGYAHKEVTELLIANGADVNVKDGGGDTPLHYAALKGHKEIVELLIAKGADVNAKGDGESTPLHYAAFNGHKEMFELLIASGADVNAMDKEGKTPLDWAIKYKHTEIADLLRKHGGKTSAELKAEGK